MSSNLNAAVEELQSRLQAQLAEVAETKKAINTLRKVMGVEPLYAEAMEQAATSIIRPDQFYGKPLATAAQEYLERRKQASTADEILKALEQGGYDFAALGWKEKDRLRSLAISLAKNTKTFHKLPNNTFGLLAWYDQAIVRRVEKEARSAEEPGAPKVVTKAEGA
jgi:hypothetical protein